MEKVLGKTNREEKKYTQSNFSPTSSGIHNPQEDVRRQSSRESGQKGEGGARRPAGKRKQGPTKENKKSS